MSREHSPVPIPPGINAIDMHRITWPQMGAYIRREVGQMLAAANNTSIGELLVLRDRPTRYRTASQTAWLDRIAA